MGNFNFKIDVSRLEGVKIEGEGDNAYLRIPIADNNVYLSERGGIYFNFTASELPEDKRALFHGQTHVIKPRVSKERYSKMSIQERNKIPVIGGFDILSQGPASTYSSHKPTNEAPARNPIDKFKKYKW